MCTIVEMRTPAADNNQCSSHASERLITPTPFGTPGLNHCRARRASANHPDHALARSVPERVRSETSRRLLRGGRDLHRVPPARDRHRTASRIPASIAEIAASFTPAAGTKMTEISILPNDHGFLRRVKHRNQAPLAAFAGVTPATTFVPVLAHQTGARATFVGDPTSTRFLVDQNCHLRTFRSIHSSREYQVPNEAFDSARRHSTSQASNSEPLVANSSLATPWAHLSIDDQIAECLQRRRESAATVGCQSRRGHSNQAP
jgi:hypothetical protein